MSHIIYELRHYGDFGGIPCVYVTYYEDRELAEKNLKRLALKYGEDALEIREEKVLGWDIYDDCY